MEESRCMGCSWNPGNRTLSVGNDVLSDVTSYIFSVWFVQTASRFDLAFSAETILAWD